MARLGGYEFTPGIFFVGAQLTAMTAGRNGKRATTFRHMSSVGPVNNEFLGRERAAGWKLFPTTLPDQLDREITTGRAMALGSGALGKDDR